MSAELDSSTSQGAVDTASVSETSTATDDSGWESYPDYASSEAGNTPEVAQLNQGNPDSPNGWGDYDPADYDQYDGEDGGWGDDYGETAGSGDDEDPDPWGEAYPDAAYSADSSKDTGRDGGQETPQLGDPAADSGTGNGQPDESPAKAEESEQALTPEHERISALESELAESKQQIADLKASNDELKTSKDEQAARFDELKASTDARMDRFEAMLAESRAKPPDGDGNSSGESADTTGTAVGDKGSVDPAFDKTKNTAPATAQERAEREHGRRFLNADNIGIAGAAVGTAEALGQLAAHASPDAMTLAGATVLGLVGAFMAKREKKKKKKG
jgi:hypothetical protein